MTILSRSPSAVRGSLLAALLAPLAGCRSFAPLAPELAAGLEAHARSQEPRRQRAELEIEGRFSGLFEAVLVSSGGPTPMLRMQVFLEVGGKLLDLAAGPERIVVHYPHEGVADVASREAGFGRDGGASAFLAASLFEVFTPITPGRVRGQRARDDGFELLLEPALPGLSVRARVDREGRLRSREYRLRRVGWRESIGGGGRVFTSGRGTRWELRESPPEAIEAPPAALFELALPADVTVRARAAVP